MSLGQIGELLRDIEGFLLLRLLTSVSWRHKYVTACITLMCDVQFDTSVLQFMLGCCE